MLVIPLAGRLVVVLVDPQVVGPRLVPLPVVDGLQEVPPAVVGLPEVPQAAAGPRQLLPAMVGPPQAAPTRAGPRHRAAAAAAAVGHPRVDMEAAGNPFHHVILLISLT